MPKSPDQDGMTPPVLVIRPGLSLWVEARGPEHATATLQAFRDGCYAGTQWYDAGGGRWALLQARLRREPTLLDRLMPWRRLPVELSFGPREEVDPAEMVKQILEVLQSEGFTY